MSPCALETQDRLTAKIAISHPLPVKFSCPFKKNSFNINNKGNEFLKKPNSSVFCLNKTSFNSALREFDIPV